MLGFLKTVGPSATDMIRADHTRVLAAFHRYQADSSAARKKAIVDMICTSLQVHAKIEEEIFYPAMRAAGSTLLDELEPEHQEMRSLIATLSGMRPGEAQYDLTFMELMRTVIHHVADEETTLFADAERLLGDELGALGARILRRRLQLMVPHTRELAASSARAMPAAPLLLAAGALVAGAWLFRRRLL
jgi:hemerythrin-like domain-containing protein